MMLRTIVLLCLCSLASCLAACVQVRPAQEEEMLRVFTADASHRLAVPAPPSGIPVIAVEELDDWRPICNQCHRGPNFSSGTLLQWGHRASCIAGKSCNQCHAAQLHRTDVRGDKANCVDCHMEQSIGLKCATCHIASFVQQVKPHDEAFLGHHGRQSTWDGKACLVCHGSQKWCFACHGIDMPHPPNIIQVHHELVQGRPEVCHNCHGTQSCSRCHIARGIKVKTE